MKSRFTVAQHRAFTFFTRNEYTSLLNLLCCYSLVLGDTNLLIDNCLSVECTILLAPLFFFFYSLLCSLWMNLPLFLLYCCSIATLLFSPSSKPFQNWCDFLWWSFHPFGYTVGNCCFHISVMHPSPAQSSRTLYFFRIFTTYNII